MANEDPGDPASTPRPPAAPLGWPATREPAPSAGTRVPIGWPAAHPAPPAAEPEPEPAAEPKAEPDPVERVQRRPAPAAAPPRRRRRGRRALVAVLVVVVLVVAAGVGVFRFGPDRVRALVVEPASPTPTVPRPTPTTASPVLGTPTATASPRAAAVQSRLGSLLSSKALGTRFGAYVVDPETDATLLTRRGTTAATPASTAKIATSVAALNALGPDARLTTSVVRDGATVTLVGGGDPTLRGAGKQPKGSGYPAYAKLSTLAARTAAALGADAGAVRVRVDDSLYEGSRIGPGWKPNYVPEGSVAPVSALMVDHGKRDPRKGARVGDPALDAGRQFAQLLAKHGVDVSGKPKRAAAADGASTVAEVRSPTVADLVEEALTYSDNDLAEALARQVALKEGEPASFTGGATAVHAVLERLGVGTGIALVDGSGLSTRDRVTPAGLTGVLRLVASGDHPELSAVLSGMPVGGYSGTLADRFGAAGGSGGVGVVRAKTGTLDGVSSLAGYVQDQDGRVLVFAFVANGIPKSQAAKTRPALDRLAAALAGCGCS